MGYVNQAPTPVSLAVSETIDKFAVRRVFCVGRNYGDHAREMGHSEREAPFFFSKPADTLIGSGAQIAYPLATDKLHHEVELVVAIETGGVEILPTNALSHIWGFAVGIDLTRRDLQAIAKAAGRPWDMAKGFDQSAPIGALHRMADVGPMASGAIRLSVNGQERQHGNLADMLWPVADIIAQLSQLVALAPGDLIFTGTPAGVGALQPGDQVVAQIEGLSDLVISISEREAHL